MPSVSLRRSRHGKRCVNLVMLAVGCYTVLAAPSVFAGPAKELYGTDDRLDMFEVTDRAVSRWAKSVCGIVYREDVVENRDGTFALIARPLRLDGLPPCSDERFREQPAAMICTAFVVGRDLVATAGHCLLGNNAPSLEEFYFVFGFEMAGPDAPVTTVPADHVYRSVELLYFSVVSYHDAAVVRLDRPITGPGAAPLPIRRRGRVAADTPLGIIGHPLGWPKKAAFGETTRVTDSRPLFTFVGNWDASGGNSGSPIINRATGVVEGVYVSSFVDDFVFETTCFRSNAVGDNEAGQVAVRTNVFAYAVPPVAVPPGALSCAASTRRSRSRSAPGDALLALGTVAALHLIASRRRNPRRPRC